MILSPASSYGREEFSRTIKALPRNEDSLILSSRTQKRLSGYGYMNVGLPPASPSDREIMPMDDESTLFLLAGYARYSCPYVWVRSNHERLVRTGDGETARDSPLKLKSTALWGSEDIRLWDILEELVMMNTEPQPANPFAIDLPYFQSLGGLDAILATSAMIHFLQRVLDSGHHGFDDAILADIRQLTAMHFDMAYSMRRRLVKVQPIETIRYHYLHVGRELSELAAVIMSFD